jgi:hypothetical protein
MIRLLVALVLGLLALGPARADPVALKRGVNITNWFRYPANRDPAVLGQYLSDPALADLRAAGFDFVRLAVDPALEADRPLVLAAIRRIQAQGLTVVVSPHPHDWRLEEDPAPLRRFWQSMAPALASLDPVRTVPEVLNEPVFPRAAAAWAELQGKVLADIRRALPGSTVVLTGADWGSIGGLLALRPVADANVIYSFHFYDPSELTSLAAYRPAADHAGFARLPFPVADAAECGAAAAKGADPVSRDLMRYYCSLGWDNARIAATIGQATEWAKVHRVRLLAGEFGASQELNRDARLAWLAAVKEACEAQSIPWALWGLEDGMGLGVPRPPPYRPRLNAGVLTALGLVAQNERRR